MDALHSIKNDEALVWQGSQADTKGIHRECPARSRCDHKPGSLPAYYLTTDRRFPGRAFEICEDRRLWINYQADERRRIAEGYGEDESDNRTIEERFAEAREEFQFRQEAVQREYLQLCRLIGGEPEIEVFESEVAEILNQVVYCLDCWHDAKVEHLERMRRLQEVKPVSRRKTRVA